jgi:hypothetical protein
VTACGLAALLTGILVVCFSLQTQLRGITQVPWTTAVLESFLSPIAWAAPPLAAGALCLRRRRVSRLAPAAVFGSCAPLFGMAVQQPAAGLQGAVVLISVLLAMAAGVATLAAAVLTGRFARQSRRSVVLWCAVAVAFTAVSIPSPVSFPPVQIQPFPVQTIFSGDTHAQLITAVLGLLFAAVPLIAAGLVSARAAAAIMAGWLPVMAGGLLSELLFPGLDRVDFWFYVACLAWLAVAVLALAQARSGWGRERDT